MKRRNRLKTMRATVRSFINHIAVSQLLVVIIVITSVSAMMGCSPFISLDNPQSTFDTSGPVARSQLTLFYWILGASVFVFITVGGALLYIIFRYRRRPGDPDPPQTHGHKNLEIAWTIIPIIVLAIVAVPTVTTIFYNANSPEPEALTVNVVAHQWWWEFRYPHPTDADEEVITANELHIPVNKVVNVVLDSKDVLHSFWIPKLAGKVDLVPNNTNVMWIEADHVGEYLGQCAEFCGIAHAAMRFRVVAEPQEEFDAWLIRQAAPAFSSTDPLVTEGRALFEDQAQCFSCHTVDGVKKARGTNGPNLTHLGSRSHIAAGLFKNTQANLRMWLTDPEAAKPGNSMAREAVIYTDPDRGLTEAQVSALVAFLGSLE